MKISIVEDSPQKLEAIIDFLQTNFPSYEKNIFGSFQCGLKGIKQDVPDIVILDMTLPTFDRTPGQREGRFRPLGGYEVMRKLKLKKINTKVIILTQLEVFGEGADKVSFEDISVLCKQEFDKMFVASIRYRHSDNQWQHELKECIKKGVC